MTGSMKTESSQVMFLGQFRRNRIRIRAARNRVVKCGVENGSMRDIAQQLPGRFDAVDVGRIVQRRQGKRSAQRLHNIVVQ